MSRQIRTKEILSLMDAGFSRALIEKMQHMSKTSVLVLFEAADRLGMSWKGSSMPTQSLCRHPLYRHAGFQGGDFSLEFVGSSVYLPTYLPSNLCMGTVHWPAGCVSEHAMRSPAN